jgi:hypothetical protein
MNTMKKWAIGGIIASNISIAIALSPQDNLGTWRISSFSEQASVCQEMVSRLTDKGSLTPSDLCTCISGTAGDGGLDFMKVSQTAAACAVELK